MADDRTHADEIRAATQALNVAINTAIKAGLLVDVKVESLTRATYAQQPVVSALVARPL